MDGDPGAAADGPTGVLWLAATPIGDPRDASPRLTELLSSAPVVAAEDTRRLLRLCRSLGVTPAGRVISYHEHNEARRTAELVALLAEGLDVVLVTDAGMPSVSDPGYRVVAAAIEIGARVRASPGPSAVLAALAVSGLAVDRFCFEGFLPRRAGERSSALAGLSTEPRTLVFFEAPHRTASTLVAMAEAFGDDRRAALCRELTKTHEQVVRGTLAELADWAGGGAVRGEVTLVVAGAPPQAPARPADLVGEVAALVAGGSRVKAAVTAVADRRGVSKRELYDEAVRAGIRAAPPSPP